MAYKFILSHHIKRILNDAEDKQKKDIKDYAAGHLNESVLLKAPISFHRQSWASAHAPDIQLVKPSKPQHQPRAQGDKGTPKEALFDFSLGTAGVIPPFKTNVPKSPDVRYKLVPAGERSLLPPSRTSQSLYSQLEDGVLIEELPPQELMMRVPRVSQRATMTSKLLSSRSQEAVGTDDPQASADLGEQMLTQDPFTSKPSGDLSPLPVSPLPPSYTLLPMHSKGITRQDQYRRMKAFDASVLQKKELSERNVLSGEKAAKHHEQKLQQDLSDLNLNGIGPNFHRLQVFSNVLEDVVDESPTFNFILRCIKTEYDNYIAGLLDSQTSQQHLLRDQVDQMASRGTSRPDHLSQVMQRLHTLEVEAKSQLDLNQRLRDDVAHETELLNKSPENPISRRTPPVGGFSKKDEKVELCLELENMKALILEKMDELGELRVRLREKFVPVTVCTHLEQCIKETEVEVQKLLKQNEYFERSIAEMEGELKEAIVDADTSEKDARRIWHKVNSTKGLRQGTASESDDDDDDETKWNWYIS